MHELLVLHFKFNIWDVKERKISFLKLLYLKLNLKLENMPFY